MSIKEVEQSIQDLLTKQCNDDAKLHNAYLLVHSNKLNIHINIAEGYTDDTPATPQQANYMASVGKIFTATLIGILEEKDRLSFDDPISDYLPAELIDGLHVYKGRDYSQDIEIRHLLNQTSGLPDNFWPLLKRLLDEPNFNMSPAEAIEWTKQHKEPHAPPGKKTKYTDTNYHLLGLIIEHITKAPFHEALSAHIFDPLSMKHSYMLHQSSPTEPTGVPEAGFYLRGKVKMNDLKSYAGLDYAGGGVVAPMEDLLKFMQALRTDRILQPETLERMKYDGGRLYPGIKYGYGIWQIITIPLLMPEKYNSWGVAGATGAFMFYHPHLDTYLIGTLNDSSYQRKGLRFMMRVINQLYKLGT